MEKEEDNEVELSIGDRVQLIGDGGSIHEGIWLSTTLPKKDPESNPSYWRLPPEELLDYQTLALVKWDDGEETSVDLYSITGVDSELERQFRLESRKIMIKIDKKLDAARKALREAVDLSEEHGIPFNSSISFLSQSYTPSSLSSIYSDLDKEFVTELTGAYNEYDNEG